MRIPLLLTVALVAVSACAPDTLPEVNRPVRGSRPFVVAPRPPCDPALIAAVENGRTDEIRRLAASGIPANCGALDDPTPLSTAIHEDAPELVRALLEAGADPNARWTYWGDRLPLQEALEAEQYGHPFLHQLEVVRLLLEHGADANARWCPFETRVDRFGWEAVCVSEGGTTPLARAVWSGNAEIVAMLLDAGADAKAADWLGMTPFDYLQDSSVASVLLPRTFPDEETRGASALRAMGDCKGCQWSPTNGTPMGRALTEWQSVIPPPPPPPPPPCRLFGTPRECRAEEEATRQRAEREARRVERRATGRVSILLDLGSDPNEHFRLAGADWPAIALASRESLKALLDHGAKADARWCVPVSGWSYNAKTLSPMPGCALERGMTRLMMAAANGNVEDVTVLLEHGADATLTNWEGRTAADYARASGKTTIVSLLRSTGRRAP